jgi:hypothetical protein
MAFTTASGTPCCLVRSWKVCLIPCSISGHSVPAFRHERASRSPPLATPARDPMLREKSIGCCAWSTNDRRSRYLAPQVLRTPAAVDLAIVRPLTNRNHTTTSQCAAVGPKLCANRMLPGPCRLSERGRSLIPRTLGLARGWRGGSDLEHVHPRNPCIRSVPRRHRAGAGRDARCRRPDRQPSTRPRTARSRSSCSPAPTSPTSASRPWSGLDPSTATAPTSSLPSKPSGSISRSCSTR